MSKIKLVQIIPHMGNGGAQQVVANYVKKFKNDDVIDCKLLVIESKTNSKYDKFLEQEKVDVKYLNHLKKYSNISFINRIKRMSILNKNICAELENCHPNIVHVHTINTLIFCVRFLKRNKNVPVFITIHSNPMRSRGISLKMIRYILKKYNVTLICLNEKQKEIAKKHFNLKDTLIVRNGIDISSIKKEIISKKEARKKYNIPASAFLIIGVGRLNKIKRFDLLIKSFSYISKNKKNAMLVIAGSGDEYDNLANLVKELDLVNSVKLIGNLENVIPLYCAADVFAMTSESEASPLALIEAQICDLKCVISNGVPLESVVTNRVVAMEQDASDEQWAEQILNCDGNVDKVCDLSDYEIDNTLKVIKQLYIKYGE